SDWAKPLCIPPPAAAGSTRHGDFEKISIISILDEKKSENTQDIYFSRLSRSLRNQQKKRNAGSFVAFPKINQTQGNSSSIHCYDNQQQRNARLARARRERKMYIYPYSFGYPPMLPPNPANADRSAVLTERRNKTMHMLSMLNQRGLVSAGNHHP
ncbi:unnamed protein product, partial [Ectocarpus sp. 12 AP-2014]